MDPIVSSVALIGSATQQQLLHVAYKGVPGAKKAASKAYPSCDQFKVELWISDRVVLLVENSLGGCIHRNYAAPAPAPHRRRGAATRSSVRGSTRYFSPLPWIDKNTARLMDS
ncbi:hypothetical protein PVAP13_2KG291000 [Panicum virgatum]|uniref:Uncharacterized protein n=1 Tax=Panicum virgatum TaxID=38727 RepID=A0A8T0WC68_PANVG|nr:hypothetical protein PVAP13_2KG291000 [Panicum virgatum]